MTNTIIHWQYPDEPPNRILGADSWISEMINVPCTGTNHQITYARAGIGVNPEGRTYYLDNWNQKFELKGWQGNDDPPFTNIRLYRGDSLVLYAPTVEEINEEDWFWHWSYKTSGLPPFDKQNYKLILDSRTRKNLVPLRSSAKGIKIIAIRLHDRYITGGVPLPECPPKCRFQIFANDEVVYERIEDICPEVREEPPDKCPPRTCPVPCHNHICCYSASGIVIKKI